MGKDPQDPKYGARSPPMGGGKECMPTAHAHDPAVFVVLDQMEGE